MKTKVWREEVVIPTYEVGQEERNPIFLEKRVYQGSSGVVYPYPVIESIANERTDHTYNALWLENEYLKVMILPELGGRVQMAFDKIRKRHFVYYNHVIKPALVGLTGPWVSGGIEFNWPQHHRPSTFLPVDCDIEEEADGSVTVWCNEMERMFHQKGLVGFTLRPGRAYLEIRGRLSNRTSLPQTFLWWANPAVEVNDYYQSVFPPDINAVFDHGKRAVSSFPIATGTYYKMDYSAGVDISNYKNIKVPTSYMGVNSHYDFEGGYENDTQAGMLHVASHHFSPGKKQWTWGNGDFGRAWDRNLTDDVTPEESEKWKVERKGFRPYIELMAGVYTENQPDFTWLMPYEEKQFTQYFMPYRELGIVKQATRDFLFNIEEQPDGHVRLKVLATSLQDVSLTLLAKSGKELYVKKAILTPEEVLVEDVDVLGFSLQDLRFVIKGRQPRPLLTWQAEPDEVRPIPDSAEAALPPTETKTIDQLFLTGLHLEQYRHATWSALDYYEEALRRDPNDVRCLNQMGLWYLRRGRFDKAEQFLRRSVKVWQKRNPNPYDGEPLFNLALALKFQHRSAEAYELFWKSTWNKAWADAGYFEAACISVSDQRYEDALEELNRCLISNSHNHKARALKASVLRLISATNQRGGLQMGSSKDLNDRLALIRDSLAIDRFNYGIRYEQYLLTKDEELLDELKRLMRRSCHNYHELALDYMQAGLYAEASDICRLAEGEGATSPMTYYYWAWATHMQGKTVEAIALLRKAEQTDSCCCFPNRLEDIEALSLAIALNPDGARAPYYLGCLYYDKRQYDVATENWELAARLDGSFPTVWRNLALAAYNKQNRKEEAVELMERAFHLNESDSRILMELDQLYKVMGRRHEERLTFLRQYPDLILKRDDLVLEEITLLNQTGRYEEAKTLLDQHQFHPWEGGEGKVPAQYQTARAELAKEALLKGKPDEAIALLEACLCYPAHLGEGKLYGAQENDFFLLMGLAYEQKGEATRARECYERATEGPTEPAAALYYNDAKPDKIFYAALAYRKLGEESKARSLFHRLLSYGEKHIFDQVRMDYFAVSLPDLLIWDGDLQQKNTVHCQLMMALGHLGLGCQTKGLRFLEGVESMDVNHPVPSAIRSLLKLGLFS